jgi:hypothetical protein
VNLIGATADDARDIMIEGESGILAICPRHERPRYLPSKRRLEWPNGARSLIFTADASKPTVRIFPGLIPAHKKPNVVSVRSCIVTIVGHDGKLHTDEFWAGTIFDAADKAIQSWNRLSWFGDSDIEIEDCNGHWRVNQSTMQQWRRARTQDLQNRCAVKRPGIAIRDGEAL